jgi:hypothetical protein
MGLTSNNKAFLFLIYGENVKSHILIFLDQFPNEKMEQVQQGLSQKRKKESEIPEPVCVCLCVFTSFKVLFISHIDLLVPKRPQENPPFQ